MKIFLDTADTAQIKRWVDTGLVDGVTTNPTLLAKVGTKSVVEHIKEISNILPGKPVSVEVTETEPEKIYDQALKISELANNIVVKVPCYIDYIPVIKRLVEKKIEINVTLVFSLTQALSMCKLGVKYISPFIGRLNDIDCDGIALVDEIRQVIENYNFITEIIAASIRSVQQINLVALIGAHIATVPADLLEKSLNNPLTDAGMKKFIEDWQKLGIKQFP